MYVEHQFNSASNQRLVSSSRGFTLIELMITLFVISILAVVAIPAYRKQIVDNAESQAQAEMRRVEIDLNRWRASALSYQGFVPKINVSNDGDPIYGYNDSDNTFIYLPTGSTANNYKYILTIVDGSSYNSLVPEDDDLNIATGRSWRMLAVPNTSGLVSGANRLLLTSTGLSCKNKYSNQLIISSTECGAGGETW